MKINQTDILIVGAGPVGLMCAYLAKLCGLDTVVVDKSEGPLKKGRADALNARTLQLLETVGLLSDLYPLGKPCNTSSVWANGGFVSRQSAWWDELEGCFHKHFLMLGQAHIENLLDRKLKDVGTKIKRLTTVSDITLNEAGCLTTLSDGEQIQSRYLIGADGAQSFVRNHFNIAFNIIRPQIIWAVIDGVIDSDFPKVPEIIVFQADTSDVAWIPREGDIDRFYVRMDKQAFSFDEVMDKINRAMKPHSLKFKEIVWYSQFSVKESVAENFYLHDRIFLAGDACHIHSVNGGQGLNTGLADAFNLIWKLHQASNSEDPQALLQSYEAERRPVALSVIESSGELVRSTKHSDNNTHAQDYVKIIQKRAGNITGMGIRYGDEGLVGSRLYDVELFKGRTQTRLYSQLDYTKFTLLVFGDKEWTFQPSNDVNLIQIYSSKKNDSFWTTAAPYRNQAILVRPDAYIQSSLTLEH